MKGNDILNEVRILIEDSTYSRYSEINRAYREIGRLTRHNWLRGESEEMITFTDGTSSYWIDQTGMRVFSSLFVKGNDSGSIYWHLMEEVSKHLFEDKRLSHVQPDGTDRESRPLFFKILESQDQKIKIQVTPVPDETYSARVEYIKDLEEIGPDTVPTMPHSYHDLIADMAAGMILSRDKEPAERIRGGSMVNQAMKDAVNGLVKDAHANRTKNVTRPRRSVNEFI